ncbi:MAG TPA: hypothetical protein PK280_13825 [Planctomycetota bacterium]|nr:hypothetical protein [Planctomycetota bacterium]
MPECRNCGVEIEAGGDFCPKCSGTPAGSGPSRAEAGDPVSVIVPYKNPKALIGYYLAVFGLVPGIGLILGPAAVVLGALGLRDRRRNPAMHGLAHAIVALVLGGIDTLYHLVGIVALIVAANR